MAHSVHVNDSVVEMNMVRRKDDFDTREQQRRRPAYTSMHHLIGAFVFSFLESIMTKTCYMQNLNAEQNGWSLRLV